MVPMLRLMLVLSTLSFMVACSPSFTPRQPSSPEPMMPATLTASPAPIMLATPTASLSYNPPATTEIIYANLQPYAGAPRPGEECLYGIAPILSIFGDGRTGLDLRYTQSASPWQWEGQLTSQQLQTVLQGLDQQGFFTRWKSDGPNPSGTYLEFGVRLQSKTIVYISGNPDPAFYRSLVRQLLPLLHPA